MIDAVKRKAGLLFGEGSPLKDIEFDGFSTEIEYKKDTKTEVVSEEENNLQDILNEFNATNTEATSTEISVPESEL